MSGPSTLPAPTTHRLALGVFGYFALTLAPFLPSLLLLALAGAVSGEPYNWWGIVLAWVAVRQINIFLVSSLYHRGASHQSVRFHPRLEPALRLAGWLLLGLGTRTWALVHRKHHAFADTDEDPHSPTKEGESFWTIGRQSVATFKAASRDLTPYARYAKGLPDDALERWIRRDEERLYGTFGVRLPLWMALAAGCFLLAGHSPLGAALGAIASLPATNGNNLVATIWIVNGVGHVAGYRNYDRADTSTNLFPVDLLGWGEALHQNHHARPGCADLAARPWEWDPAYALLQMLQRIGLVVELKGR